MVSSFEFPPIRDSLEHLQLGFNGLDALHYGSAKTIRSTEKICHYSLLSDSFSFVPLRRQLLRGYCFLFSNTVGSEGLLVLIGAIQDRHSDCGRDSRRYHRSGNGTKNPRPELHPCVALQLSQEQNDFDYPQKHGPESTAGVLMGALVTVMVSQQLKDGCDVTQDAAAALITHGWTPPETNESETV